MAVDVMSIDQTAPGKMTCCRYLCNNVLEIALRCVYTSDFAFSTLTHFPERALDYKHGVWRAECAAKTHE
jgi:hypothetical protein